MQLNVQPILDAALAAIEVCRLNEPGHYRRFADKANGKLDPYGTADAANLLYSMSIFPRSQKERSAWVQTLQEMQCPTSGLYMDRTHHPFHTTAHCIASLELFDAAPLHHVKDFQVLADIPRMHRFLDELNWEQDPLRSSHQMGGMYATLTLMEDVGQEWEDSFFDWMDREVDPESGLMRQGCVQPLELDGIWSLFPHLSGHFHVLACCIAARRPHPFPFRLIDTVLEIVECKPGLFCEHTGFYELNVILALTRSCRICPHRFEEVQQVLTRFAPRFVEGMQEAIAQDQFVDLHEILGCVCALAELQISVPGLIRSRRPLKQILDRRPFL